MDEKTTRQELQQLQTYEAAQRCPQPKKGIAHYEKSLNL